VGVGYEYVKLATALESLVAVCFDSGNFDGSFDVYIDESMQDLKGTEVEVLVGKDQDVS
jgi:hypothetical protein